MRQVRGGGVTGETCEAGEETTDGGKGGGIDEG